MSNPIRILHLEDNPTDAELINATLSEAGLVCEFDRVEKENDFKSRLEDGGFDLVISDFSLPGYSGRAALMYVHENYPHMPFIFVSGTVGEDFAIESLLNGCTDYVLKTKMARLVPAVKRALAEKEEQAGRLEAEKAVRERDERFRILLENSNDGMVVMDVEGNVTMRSPANVRLLGQGEYRPGGGNIFDVIYPDDVPMVRGEMEKIAKEDGAKTTVVFRSSHGDGGWRWLEATLSNRLSDPSVKGIISNFRDVTDRRESENMLRQAQKMESLGTLSGGIAHDFNNILGIVIGYATLLPNYFGDREKMEKSVKAIQQAADRGVGLVRQLLMFARKQESELGPMNINDVMDEIYRLASETFPKVIVTELDVDRGIPSILADHIQVSQCILNLCVNARDAMMQRKEGIPNGGRLKIVTGIASPELVRKHSVEARAKEYVFVSVSDTGVGMDEETIARIFEPFFTTKEQGKGTGIGLATVFGVMKKHGGFVDVTSVPGKGSTFTLCFPAVHETGGRNDEKPAPDTFEKKGNETVLVVEDEVMLRELLKDTLAASGYGVIAARDGREAIDIMAKDGAISLVLTDLGLPELDGLEVLRRIKKRRPEVKVIIASGFADPAEAREIKESGADGFVQKPYRVNEVMERIRSALDAGVKVRQ